MRPGRGALNLPADRVLKSTFVGHNPAETAQCLSDYGRGDSPDASSQLPSPVRFLQLSNREFIPQIINLFLDVARRFAGRCAGDERVLVLDEGNGARQVFDWKDGPVRSVVVGIIDDIVSG